MELSIRITCDTITKAELAELIDPLCDRYIISEETAANRHFHIYLRYLYEDAPRYSKLRYIFTKAGYKGNEKISITKQKTENLQSYVVKDGDYIYKGYTEDEIEEIRNKSYKKPKGYKQEKADIANAFVNGEINTEEMYEQLILLACKWNIEFYEHKTIAFMRTQIFKRDPNSIKKFIFDSRIKNKI